MGQVLIGVEFCNPSAAVFFTVLKALFSGQTLSVFPVSQQDKVHRILLTRARISFQTSALSEKYPQVASLFQFYVFKTQHCAVWFINNSLNKNSI